MAKVVTFGEVMLRLSTPGYLRFSQARQFDATFGGGEANVAVSLANYGVDTSFVTRLPQNDIAAMCVAELRGLGVGVDDIVYGGDRVGIYYLETGAVARGSKVVYDRANSAISEIKPGMVDWRKVLQGADWFHWTGITPALSQGAADACLEAIKAANEMGVKVSCDLNYRKKLWTTEKAQSIMTPLMEYVDVCITNEEDAEKCLGFKPDSDVEAGNTDASGYHAIFTQMMEKFGFTLMASTLRESYSASDNGWKALIYDGNEFYESKHYRITPIVDRVGGGDSFSGGLIHGMLKFKDPKKALEFAVAASALKHEIYGDYNLVSEEEALALAEGNANGRVQR